MEEFEIDDDLHPIDGDSLENRQPGACGDPECHVLHADPANPIHPPEDWRMMDGDQGSDVRPSHDECSCGHRRSDHAFYGPGDRCVVGCDCRRYVQWMGGGD